MSGLLWLVLQTLGLFIIIGLLRVDHTFLTLPRAPLYDCRPIGLWGEGGVGMPTMQANYTGYSLT